MELELFHSWHNEAGQAMVEYSFILVMVAFVCFAALKLVGGGIPLIFQQVADGFPGV